MPPLIHTYTGQKLLPYQRPDLAREQPVKLSASLTLAKGTVLAWVDASNTFEAYVEGGAGGLGVARAILAYDYVTDSGAKHYLGTSAASEFGNYGPHAIAYFSGDFLASELVGMDAPALVDFNATLRYGGTLADAACVVHIP